MRAQVDAFYAEARDVGDPVGGLYGFAKNSHLREMEIPEGISIVAGEVISNLRSALDYLVFALAWHDTGRRPTGEWARGLQFPIFSKARDFERSKHRLLSGVTDEHADMIEEYQPFNGCTFTAELADLSNEDKHRHLFWLYGLLEREIEWRKRHTKNPSDESEADEAGEPVANLGVALSDGRPLVETLSGLADAIEVLLHRFAREFKLHPIREGEGWA